MDEHRKEVEPDLALFQKRAVDLMAHKFIADYRCAMHHSPGVEIESFYEIWSYNHIRELALREQVWHCTMLRLRERDNK